MCSQTHRAPFVDHIALFIEQADHGMGRVLVEFGRVCVGQSHDRPAELDGGTLHAQTDAEERDAAFARKTNGLDLALDAAFAETAGDEDAVVTR